MFATPPQQFLLSMSMGRVVPPLTPPGCQQQGIRISVLAPATEAAADADADAGAVEPPRRLVR